MRLKSGVENLYEYGMRAMSGEVILVERTYMNMGCERGEVRCGEVSLMGESVYEYGMGTR